MRYTESVTRSLRASLVLAAAVACNGGNSLPTGPSPVTAEVDFRYVLTSTQASGSTDEIFCDGPIRFHPSFWGFAQVTLISVDSTTWAARFEEVPIGRHSGRLEAPAACSGGELFANGILLSRGASVASFAVATDGSVTP
jgi:hypothetical protein